MNSAVTLAPTKLVPRRQPLYHVGNPLYKTMFDARRKIRAHLAAHGYLDDEEPRKP